MAEFMDRYGSDDKCEVSLIESGWPAGFACPSCGCDQSNSFRREGLNPAPSLRLRQVAIGQL